MVRRLQTRLSTVFRTRRVERELDAELRFHIDMLTEQKVRAGMSPEAARAAALRAFGAVDLVKEDVREVKQEVKELKQEVKELREGQSGAGEEKK